MGTVADALARLQEPQNEPLRWLNDLLVERAQKPDWFLCYLLGQLARRDQQAEAAWSDLIGPFRSALINPDEAPARARDVLTGDFDDKLDDLVAEMVAVVYLTGQGYSGFRILATSRSRMPDFEARRGQRRAFVEVKNLKVPDSIGTVAFRRWHANTARNPNAFSFNAMLEYEAVFEPQLDTAQVNVLNRVIDQLASRPRPSDFRATLPKGEVVRFILTDGPPGMICHGAILLDEQEGARDLVHKLFQGMVGKALSQLHSSSLPEGALRVIVLRWRVPDDVSFVEQEVRPRVENALARLLTTFFPDLDVHLVSSLQRF